MTNPFGFEDLKGILPRQIAHFPDHRQPGPNTRYTIKDAALGAFGIFYTQSPSFLDDQRPLQQAQGHNNAATLFGGQHIPWNPQRRNLLAPRLPRHRDGVSLEVCEGLEQHGWLRTFGVLDDQRLVALDGTQSHSSHAMHGHNGLRRHTSKGQTLYAHRALTPVIVCPRRSEVLAVPPACLRPQDGHEKQDGERMAGKRWIDTHAKPVSPHGITLLGDDLSSNQPLCTLAGQKGCNFLCVCQPDAPTTRYERVAFWQDTPAITAVTRHRRDGRCTAVTIYRSSNDVILRGGTGALSVNGVESTSAHAKTGEQLSHNSVLTTHPLTEANGADRAQAGRGRGKIEHENNHVLKTKGSHIAHHCGPGKKYLAAFLLRLNLLACLFHTVLPGCDDTYALLRQVLARRQTFFEDIRALTRSMVFESWQHLMDFMIRGLTLEAKLDTG